MPANSPTFRMADRLLGGRLRALVAEYRSAGASWEEVARRLYAEAGVEVSSETLRSWMRSTEADEGAA